MTDRSNAYKAGYSHGSQPKKVFDPDYRYNLIEKQDYRQGYSDARKGRGLE